MRIDSSGDSVTEELDALFEEMVSQQRAKVLALGRSIRPNLTDDDILSPLDIPELADDGRFNYEDGILAGLISARIAVRAHFRRGQE